MTYDIPTLKISPRTEAFWAYDDSAPEATGVGLCLTNGSETRFRHAVRLRAKPGAIRRQLERRGLVHELLLNYIIRTAAKSGFKL